MHKTVHVVGFHLFEIQKRQNSLVAMLACVVIMLGSWSRLQVTEVTLQDIRNVLCSTSVVCMCCTTI